jgi:cytidyltransferase-like protein
VPNKKKAKKPKTVLVSGCFDLLHGGHIEFLNEAASYGRLIVSVGSDRNVELLKGEAPYFSQDERRYILKAIACVSDVVVGTGMGLLDFEPELRRLKPDYFVVNEDGHAEEKRELCRALGVKYLVLKRVPHPGLPAHASSTIKNDLRLRSTRKK